MISLHNHTRWSDGALTVLELAQAAASRGITAVAATDHFETDKAACRYGREDIPAYLEECRAAERATGIRVLAGAEVDLMAIARRRAFLDYAFPDRELAALDLVLFEYAGPKFTWTRAPHPLKRGDRGGSGDTWSDFLGFRKLLRGPVFLAHPRFDLAFDDDDDRAVERIRAARVGLELNGGLRNREPALASGTPHFRIRESIYHACARAGVPFLVGCDLHERAEELDDTRLAWDYAVENRMPLFGI